MGSVPGFEHRNLLVAADRPRPDHAEPAGPAQRMWLDSLEELAAGLREVSSRSVTRAIVIEDTGPAFSAGAISRR